MTLFEWANQNAKIPPTFPDGPMIFHHGNVVVVHAPVMVQVSDVSVFETFERMANVPISWTWDGPAWIDRRCGLMPAEHSRGG